VSIASLDSLQLLQLKEKGVCAIELPELLFDLDYPGQYFRRLKSVSLTVPCVVGPYDTVNCTLRLMRHETRIKASADPQYLRTGDDDPRFVVNYAATQAIATSSGQNDSGLFEVNFRDERYLPFEGAGAASVWRLELTSPWRKFDHETMSDVILHLRYTSREGGERLKAKAVASAKELLNKVTDNGQAPLYRILSLRQEFPNEWWALTRPPAETDIGAIVRSVDLPMAKERFPFYLAGAALQPQVVHAIAVPQPAATLSTFTLSMTAGKGGANEANFDLALQASPPLKPALSAKSANQIAFPMVEADPAKAPWNVRLSLDKAALNTLSKDLRDVFLVIGYTAAFSA
jgi:hypothetical protein